MPFGISSTDEVERKLAQLKKYIDFFFIERDATKTLRRIGVVKSQAKLLLKNGKIKKSEYALIESSVEEIRRFIRRWSS